MAIIAPERLHHTAYCTDATAREVHASGLAECAGPLVELAPDLFGYLLATTIGATNLVLVGHGELDAAGIDSLIGRLVAVRAAVSA